MSRSDPSRLAPVRISADRSPRASRDARATSGENLGSGAPRDVVGVILAGGEGRRLGRVDKAQHRVAGRPLWQHVQERLAPQVTQVVLNHPRGIAGGPPWFPDSHDAPGALAGILSALAAFRDRSVLVVAVDLPRIPTDLVPRLAQAQKGQRCAYGVTGGGHALAILWPPRAYFALCSAWALLGPRLAELLPALGNAVHFPEQPEADLNINLNSREECLRFERSLAAKTGAGLANDGHRLFHAQRLLRALRPASAR